MKLNQQFASCVAVTMGFVLGTPLVSFGAETESDSKKVRYRIEDRCVGYNEHDVVETIPKGVDNPIVRIFATTQAKFRPEHKADLDLALYAADDTAFRSPIIEKTRGKVEIVDYPGLERIFYTGYWGYDGNRGNETIKITGTTPREFVVVVHGHQSGCFDAEITYYEPKAESLGHKPICDKKDTDEEGWYWFDSKELIQLANCANATEPRCSIWGPDYERWEASNWQDASGWPSEANLSEHSITELACHREAGIAMGGEYCDEDFKCFAPYHLQCVDNICTNELILVSEGCGSNEDCAHEGQICSGKTFNGLYQVGRCIEEQSQHDGDSGECETGCNEGYLCSDLGAMNQPRMCVPEWMVYNSAEERSFSSPHDILSSNGVDWLPIQDAVDAENPGVTRTYQFVTGLASVPLTALGTVVLEHSNPEDLIITAYAPGGAEYYEEYAKVLWNGPVDAQGETMIIIQNEPLFHTGDDRVNGFWALKIEDITKNDSQGTLEIWDVNISSRWD